MKEILVVGAGAMGCLFGARLAEAGYSVTLVDVWREHIDTVNTTGLRFDADDGERTVRMTACTAAEAKTRPELVIVFTKALHTGEALRSVSHLFDDRTYLLTLQNGIGNAATAAQYLNSKRILQGVTNYPSDFIGPGHISTHGSGYVKIQPIENQVSVVPEAIAAALRQAGFNCSLDPNVERTIWEKVAFNAALNSLTAVTQLAVGGVGNNEHGRLLAMKIVAEVCEVAHAKNIPANEADVRKSVLNAFSQHGDHKPSMLQDILAHRKTEIDAINGAVVSEAAKAGISVPVTETLYRLVHLLESK